MHTPRRNHTSKAVAIALAAIAALMLTACKRGSEDIPFGAIPQPVGAFQNTWQDAQAFKAEAADFVVYTYEWNEGTTALNPVGRRHLSELLPRMGTDPFNIVIQPDLRRSTTTEDQAGNTAAEPLDMQRRLAIIERLRDHEVASPEERVLIATVEGGLYGDESVLIQQTFPYGGSSQNNASTARSSAGNVSRGSVNNR